MDFSQLGFLFAIASVFGIIAAKFKQPLFIGYLFAGLFLKYFGLINDPSSLESLGHLGISLLLFLLGLEMNLRDINSVGRPAFITGFGQIIVNFILGYFLSSLLGFGNTASFYIGVALTFSSTIIAVKLLSEKDDLESLYGRLSVGLLLVQDLVAVILLLFLGSLGSGGGNASDIAASFLNGAALILSVWVISKKILPLLFEKISASSNELMFIVSISWALGFSAFVAKYTGFTLEVGGFLAGLSLSGLPEHLQIAVKAKPLRDFFLTIYFLILGTSLVIKGGAASTIIYAIIFSIFVFLTHILIVMALLGTQGFKKRTSFFVATSGSQISEFSLIIASIGILLGHLMPEESAIITLTAVLTMSLSTILIGNTEKIYEYLKNTLSIFEKKLTHEGVFHNKIKVTDHILLVGCDRTGRQLVKYFERKKLKYLVVDFNPKVIRELRATGTPVIFGDINDSDVLELANVEDSYLVILTTSNLTDNLTFLEYLKLLKSKPMTIFTSSNKQDAKMLYEEGAQFVIVPEMVAGDYIKHLLKTYGTGKSGKLVKAGKNHFKRLAFI